VSVPIPLFGNDGTNPAQPFSFAPDWPHHGKPYGYKTGCRCAQCIGAYRTEKRRHKAAAKSRAGRPHVCKRCGRDYFYASHPDNGWKYCAQCRLNGPVDRLYDQGRAKATTTCPWCAKVHSSTRRWGVCDECYVLLPEFVWVNLRRHHAALEFVNRLRQSPTCEICGLVISAKRIDRKGRLRSALALDHDHACCPGAVSCGKCLRGVLCNRCNVAIGYLKDDHRRASAAHDYLKKVSGP